MRLCLKFNKPWGYGLKAKRLMRKLTARKADQGVRADVFVASKYPQFSRSSLGMLFDKGMVMVKDRITKASHKLHAGDKVLIDEKYLKAKPPALKLPIIYEDNDVIVIDKPTGTLTHSKGALNLEGSVASFIAPKLKMRGPLNNRSGIVHRLDRATSGVIITAKNAKAMASLQKQFAKRKAKKTYIAIVEGKVEPEQAVISAPLMRNPARPQTFKVGSAGKSAETQYQVLDTLVKGGKAFTKLLLIPKTGRTHQLRVHMAYINHPIVGDRLYGHEGKDLLLHAQSLELTLPSSERKVFSAELPKRFEDFWE